MEIIDKFDYQKGNSEFSLTVQLLADFSIGQVVKCWSLFAMLRLGKI